MADNQFPNLTQAAMRMAVFGIIFVVIASVGAGCMATKVNSGEGVVKYSIFGGTDVDAQYGEGLQLHWPWVTLVTYDLRVQESLEVINALSSNGLSIGMDASIRWRPQRAVIGQLHVTYGRDYYRKLVQPELRSAVREIVGQYTPEELYSSRRTELQGQVEERIRQVVEEQYVTLDAVLIRDIQLPEQIKLAIENKLKEEQEAERYEFTIVKERLEAERKKIEAGGEAEYQRIITASLTNQFLRFKGIEATLALANSTNAKTVIVGGGGGDGLPLILGGN